jgi:hypothetical protein
LSSLERRISSGFPSRGNSAFLPAFRRPSVDSLTFYQSSGHGLTRKQPWGSRVSPTVLHMSAKANLPMRSRSLRAVSEAHRRETVAGEVCCGPPARFRYSDLKEAAAHYGVWVLNSNSSVGLWERPGFCESDKERGGVFESRCEPMGADLRWKIGGSGRGECGWRHTKPVRVATRERFELRSSLS